MQKTIDTAMLERAIFGSFALEPIPNQILSSTELDDFANDINKALHTKKWSDVKLDDWRMTGLSAAILARYMTPAAFVYYLPSLMVGGVRNNDFDFAIEALRPANQRHEPRGNWWQEFVATFDVSQRETIKLFLNFVEQVAPSGSLWQVQAQEALRENHLLISEPR